MELCEFWKEIGRIIASLEHHLGQPQVQLCLKSEVVWGNPEFSSQNKEKLSSEFLL